MTAPAARRRVEASIDDDRDALGSERILITTLFDRFEFKFVVSRRQRRAITAELRRHMRPDPFGDRTGCYPTIDLYYDNEDFETYWERWRGIPSRRKLRVRVYGGERGTAEAASFLEIKHALDGRICKRRVALPVAEALAVLDGRPAHRRLSRTEERVVAEAVDLVRWRGMRPVCVVRCERQAFVGTDAEEDLRVTFDQNIRFRTHDLVPRPNDCDMEGRVLGTDPCVMEVKVASAVPRWLVEQITRHGCVMQSHSKFSRVLEQAALVPTANGYTPAAPALQVATKGHLSPAVETLWSATL